MRIKAAPLRGTAGAPAAPLRGTAGAPATGLRVEDARPARARRCRSSSRGSARIIGHRARDCRTVFLSFSLSGSRLPRRPGSHPLGSAPIEEDRIKRTVAPRAVVSDFWSWDVEAAACGP